MIFPDIESYIEFMAGYRDKTGIIPYWSPGPPMQLASYDVGFVTNVAEQTLASAALALSVKQASLADLLIKKYEKQLKHHMIEQPNHKNYRFPLREVKHISSLTVEDEMLHLRFPFDNVKILEIKAFANKDSQGRVFWKKEKSAWVFSLTEYNVNWAVTYAKSKFIPVSNEAQSLFDLIIEVEKTPYKIELNINNQQPYIENAPESLTKYIEDHFGFNDLLQLVDNSAVLGYTVNPEIQAVLTTKYGPTFMTLCNARNLDFTPNKTENHTISELVEWAIEVNRLPICVYNPNFLSDHSTEFQKYFKSDEIAVINMHTNETGIHTDKFDPKIKFIYTNKVFSLQEGEIFPLLITYANLMHGVAKRDFLDKAQKIIYFCETLPRIKNKS